MPTKPIPPPTTPPTMAPSFPDCLEAFEVEDVFGVVEAPDEEEVVVLLIAQF
jgi:hypothetical protein